MIQLLFVFFKYSVCSNWFYRDALKFEDDDTPLSSGNLSRSPLNEGGSLPPYEDLLPQDLLSPISTTSEGWDTTGLEAALHIKEERSDASIPTLLSSPPSLLPLNYSDNEDEPSASSLIYPGPSAPSTSSTGLNYSPLLYPQNYSSSGYIPLANQDYGYKSERSSPGIDIKEEGCSLLSPPPLVIDENREDDRCLGAVALYEDDDDVEEIALDLSTKSRSGSIDSRLDSLSLEQNSASASYETLPSSVFSTQQLVGEEKRREISCRPIAKPKRMFRGKKTAFEIFEYLKPSKNFCFNVRLDAKLHLPRVTIPGISEYAEAEKVINQEIVKINNRMQQSQNPEFMKQDELAIKLKGIAKETVETNQKGDLFGLFDCCKKVLAVKYDYYTEIENYVKANFLNKLNLPEDSPISKDVVLNAMRVGKFKNKSPEMEIIKKIAVIMTRIHRIKRLFSATIECIQNEKQKIYSVDEKEIEGITEASMDILRSSNLMV